MPESLKHLYRPPSTEGYKSYLLTTGNLPPVDITRLETQLLVGAERGKTIKTPITGDATLVLIYKRKEGFVASFGLTEEDLEILQLQGAKAEGYRVNRGLMVVDFFADQIKQLTSHPESGLKRITMPPLFIIQGLVDATETAMSRYDELALRLGMKFSNGEKKFIKDVK